MRPGPRRRARLNGQNAAARAPRFDSLAIGGPLTAAFVGLMLADVKPASGGAGEENQTETSAARSGPGGETEIGPDQARSAGVAELNAAAHGSAAGDGTGTTEQPVSDPTTVPGDLMPAEAHAAATGPDVTVPAADLSSGVDAKASLVAGVALSMTSISLNLDPLAEGTAGSAGHGGSIGAVVIGSSGNDVIQGTEGNDRLSGGAGDDVILGYGGNDRLDGGDGNDQLDGGSGNDDLYGGAGNDQLFGNSGKDGLEPGTGLFGGPGNDLVDGGTGADRMEGGTGNDQLIVDNLHDIALDTGRGSDGGGTDTLQVDGDSFAASLAAAGRPTEITFLFSDDLGSALPEGAHAYTQQVAPGIENVVLGGSTNFDVIGDSGDNQITGNAGDNVLFGGGGNDILSGGAGNDHLDGGAGNDLLQGDAGNDILSGGAGADQIYGGEGNDILSGGAGADQLYGGAGDDTFVIGLNDSAVDTVFDHEGSNQLTLEGFDGGTVQTALVGDDLYVLLDNNPIALVSDYRGHEEAWAGIDTGQGPVPFDDLMARPTASAPPPTGAAASTTAGSGQDDLLSGYLSSPSHLGGAGADQLVGTDAADWLSGLAGNDHLQGGAGNDILEGGSGSDRLEGGAGDDRYLFTSGESGFDTIHDTEGSNVAELHGFGAAKVQGVISGQNLIVVAANSPLFTVEDFVGHEQAFAGVQTDQGFVPTDDLFSHT
jgi:Ca2+-binding RTX toxin-like protein